MASGLLSKITKPKFAKGGIPKGNITVLGGPELAAKFKAISSFAALRTGHTVYELAILTQTRAMELVLVDTGNLQSGIYPEKTSPYSWNVIASSRAGSDPGGAGKNEGDEYANFNEFGTSKWNGKPFMRPAFNYAAQIAPVKLQAVARELETKFRASVL